LSLSLLPILLLLYQLGAFSPNECAMSNDTIPWISEEWTPEKAGITNKYTLDNSIVEKFRKLLHDWHEAGYHHHYY